MTRRETARLIEDPPLARMLFNDVRWSWIWLLLRLYLGWTWLTEGIDKATSPLWVGPQAGGFLTGWIGGALKKTGGPHPDVSGWYAWVLSTIVLPHASFWSHAVAYGEVAIGAGLILGMFTGIAAFFGGVLNGSYLLAGTVSTNPVMFAGAVLLVLAWKTAGWWGIDRWLLGKLGTPWSAHAPFVPAVAP